MPCFVANFIIGQPTKGVMLMRLPKLNIHAPNDWKGDLTICIKAMKQLIGFFVAILIVTAAFIAVYHTASGYAKPFDVFSAEDWQKAVQDPFVDTVILHVNIKPAGGSTRKMTVITDF
jgi:hypothetical protein